MKAFEICTAVEGHVELKRFSREAVRRARKQRLGSAMKRSEAPMICCTVAIRSVTNGSLTGQRSQGRGRAPRRFGPLAQPAGLGTTVHAQDARDGRRRCLDAGGGGHVRAAGFLPWLARHRLAWQRWRDVVGGRRRRRQLLDWLGNVGGGPLVLTHLTHPRTVANPHDST